MLLKEVEFTLYQNYQNSLDLQTEDIDVINEFYETITNNPFDIEITKRFN